MKRLTAEYLNEDDAYYASFKMKDAIRQDKTLDTLVTEFENSNISNDNFPKEKFTLLTTGVINNAGVFITDPVTTELTSSDFSEDTLKSRSQLAVICSDKNEKKIENILSATCGENIHISSFWIILFITILK